MMRLSRLAMLGASLLVASSFVLIAPGAPASVAAPPPPDRVNQVNDDGFADLVVVQSDNTLDGFHNGSLVNPGGVPYGGGPTWRVGNSNWSDVIHMAAGDINHDGFSDLVAVKTDGTLEIYYNGILVNQGGLPYTTAAWRYSGQWQNARHFAVADVTGDQYADIVFVDADQSLVVYANGSLVNPGGSPFSTETWRFGNWSGTRNLVLTDVNRDGYSDIVAVNASGQLFGYNNATLVSPGGQPFTTQSWIIPNSNWTNVTHLTAGDVNRDGYGDLIGVRTDGDITIFDNGTLVNPGGIPYSTETWRIPVTFGIRNIA